MEVPKDVYIRISIRKLFDIQPHLDKFTSIYILQTTWKEKSLKLCNKAQEEAKNEIRKNPPVKIFVSNTVEEKSRKEDVLIYMNVYNICLVRFISKVRAILSFKASGLMYPFEELRLPFYVTTSASVENIMFLTDPFPSTISIKSDSKWFFKEKVNLKKYYTNQTPHGGRNMLPLDYIGVTHPVMLFSVTANRMLPHFYFMYFTQQSILGLCSLSVFCINLTLVHFRFIFTLMFMLILLLFKVLSPTTNDNPINYLELSFWLNWSIQAVLMLWHFCAKDIFEPHNTLQDVDKIIAFSTLGIYILQNVIVVPHIHRNIFKFQNLLFNRWIPRFVSRLNKNSAFDSSYGSSSFSSDDSHY